MHHTSGKRSGLIVAFLAVLFLAACGPQQQPQAVAVSGSSANTAEPTATQVIITMQPGTPEPPTATLPPTLTSTPVPLGTDSPSQQSSDTAQANPAGVQGADSNGILGGRNGQGGQAGTPMLPSPTAEGTYTDLSANSAGSSTTGDNGAVSTTAEAGQQFQSSALTGANTVNITNVTTLCSTPTSFRITTYILLEHAADNAQINYVSTERSGEEQMTWHDGDVWDGVIGPFRQAGTVTYWISAMDQWGQVFNTGQQTLNVTTNCGGAAPTSTPTRRPTATPTRRPTNTPTPRPGITPTAAPNSITINSVTPSASCPPATLRINAHIVLRRVADTAQIIVAGSSRRVEMTYISRDNWEGVVGPFTQRTTVTYTIRSVDQWGQVFNSPQQTFTWPGCGGSTATPTLRPTNTATPRPTNTPTLRPTNTGTPRPTNTPVPGVTNTATPRPTNTPTLRPTNTATPRPTNTPTLRPTNTATPRPTNTATPRPTNTATPRPTNTPTPRPTNTPVPQPTNTPVPGGYQRPFNSNSIWNRPVGSAAVHPSSSHWMQILLNEWPNPNAVPIEVDGISWGWSVPVYTADANTPRYQVCDTDGRSYCSQVPIPNGFMPSPDGDGKAVIIDTSVTPNRAWSFWRIAYQNGRWSAEYGAFGWTPTDSSGDGLINYEGGQWGGRASSWNYLPGLINPEEIRQGSIDHALAIILPGQVVGNFSVWPSFGSDGYSSDPNPIPYGVRFQLDPSVDVNSLNLSAAGKIIARALQTYGAWMGDTGSLIGLNAREYLYRDGNGNVRVDSSPWSAVGMTNDVLYNFPTHRLRVVQVNQADFYRLPNNRD